MFLASQRAAIKNLASALAEQNNELERLKEDLMDMSRDPVQPQYFNYPGQLSLWTFNFCIYFNPRTSLKTT